jgi:two-component system, LytTR family, response regulator LytT
MKILIAEDEAIIAISLFTVLTELGYQPLDPAATGKEAIATIESQKPEMAVVDIHLGEYYSGFAVAEKLQQQNIPFIFLTALFDKETIEKAKTYNPAAYLVKPFSKQNLFATIEMSVLHQVHSKKIQESKNVLVKDGSQQIEIDAAAITYLEAENKYIFIHLADGKKHLVRSSFKDVMEQLNLPNLVQVHKSYVININCITAIKYDEIFLGDVSIPVGRTYREGLKNRV